MYWYMFIYLKSEYPIQPSNQLDRYVLDCDEVDMGCGGGLLDDAWKYLTRGGTVSAAQCSTNL